LSIAGVEDRIELCRQHIANTPFSWRLRSLVAGSAVGGDWLTILDSSKQVLLVFKLYEIMHFVRKTVHIVGS
jgi:hypothetical protein